MLSKTKRYSVRRNGAGYEVRDADAAGAQVFVSASRKEAREMSRTLTDAATAPGKDHRIHG
jgi:hypothetical protein